MFSHHLKQQVQGPLGTAPGGLISGKLNKSILLLFPIESNDILIMLCHYFLRTTTREKNSKGHQAWKTAQNIALGDREREEPEKEGRRLGNTSTVKGGEHKHLCGFHNVRSSFLNIQSLMNGWHLTLTHTTLRSRGFFPFFSNEKPQRGRNGFFRAGHSSFQKCRCQFSFYTRFIDHFPNKYNSGKMESASFG